MLASSGSLVSSSSPIPTLCPVATLLARPSNFELNMLPTLRRAPVKDTSLLSNSWKLSWESRRELGAIASILAFVSNEFRLLTRFELLANVNTDASSVIRGCNEAVEGAVGLAGVCGGNKIGVADIGRGTCENEVAAVVCEVILGGFAVSTGEYVEVLLVVAESNPPNSFSTGVVADSVCTVSPPPLTTGEPAPPPVLSEFCKLVVEKLILPASPVSKGCRILLSRTCCNRSASRVAVSPRNPSIRDLRRFSVWTGDVSALSGDGVDVLRFVPMPRRRKILRLRPPSGRKGMRFDSGVRDAKTGVYVVERPRKDHCGPSPR